MIVLRKYQERIISDAREAMRAGQKAILITSATGSGKTSLTAHMLKTAQQKGLKSWFINHRVELVEQSVNTFARVGLYPGIVAAGFPDDIWNPTQVCSIQSLARRKHRLQKPDLIVWDECAHIVAGSWAKIYSEYGNAFHIGLTATPQRLDGRGLGDFFKKIVLGPPVSKLIEDGFLSKYKIFAPSTIETGSVKSRYGDFIKADLMGAACKPVITGHAISEYKKRAIGKRAIIFCVSVEHSKQVVETFRSAGITAEHVDGETPSHLRKSAMDRFRRGELKIISNVELYGEGLDVEALEAVILLRPTQSLSLYLQQIGRVLRPFPGKEYALILDHAGNAMRHGLPDEDREWSLSGKVKRGGGEAPVKQCPECFAVMFAGVLTCIECGYVFKEEARTTETIEGDLVEVDTVALRRQRFKEQSSTVTMEELVQLGKKRGYKNPYGWAKYVFNARQAKKLARGRE